MPHPHIQFIHIPFVCHWYERRSTQTAAFRKETFFPIIKILLSSYLALISMYLTSPHSLLLVRYTEKLHSVKLCLECLLGFEIWEHLAKYASVYLLRHGVFQKWCGNAYILKVRDEIISFRNSR